MSKSGSLGFENKLWKAADKLRNNMDASRYKHVVLGLVFLKYVSDAFEERKKRIEEDVGKGADPEDPDEYKSNLYGKSVFWVPKKARWKHIQASAKLPEIGQIIDEALYAIEKENPSLKGILPKDYSRPRLDKRRLGELVDLIGTIGLGDSESRSKDVLGRVYEYFLGKFAEAEGKGGGEFYTPESIVKLLVRMIRPYQGRVYDPCCGSGGMFVQSEKFVKAHSGRIDDIYVYGQESNPTTFKLCKMNLAIRGIEGNIKYGNTFHDDQHPDLKADYVLANPPFNISDWGGEHLKEDVRWRFGIPPEGNANYAWMQHMIHHLAPNGVAGYVMSNGSLSSQTSGEGEIRRKMVEAGVVDCIVALPTKLFYNTQIPACLWFVRRNKKKAPIDRTGEVLFIDAQDLGKLVSRRHRKLTDEDIKKITDTYHAWRGEELEDETEKEYEDVPGFCKSVKLDEIKKHDFILTPGRFVGFAVEKQDGRTFEEKMKEFTTNLRSQMTTGEKIDSKIIKSLRGIGFEF